MLSGDRISASVLYAQLRPHLSKHSCRFLESVLLRSWVCTKSLLFVSLKAWVYRSFEMFGPRCTAVLRRHTPEYLRRAINMRNDVRLPKIYQQNIDNCLQLVTTKGTSPLFRYVHSIQDILNKADGGYCSTRKCRKLYNQLVQRNQNVQYVLSGRGVVFVCLEFASISKVAVFKSNTCILAVLLPHTICLSRDVYTFLGIPYDPAHCMARALSLLLHPLCTTIK